MSSYENHLPKKPSHVFKQAVRTWHLWYKSQFVLPYFYSGKDFQNLKYLMRKLSSINMTLEAFLDSIDNEWYLANASIPLYNSHFNQLVKPVASKYPDHFDAKLYKSMDVQQVQEYQKHLRDLGYKYVYNSGGSTWVKE